MLADRAHVSRAWLIDVETAKRPNAEVSRVLRVLDALEIDLSAAARTEGATSAGRPLDLDAHLGRYGR